MQPAPTPAEAEAARYRQLTRLSCLGVAAGGVAGVAGVVCLVVGISESSAMLRTLGLLVLGVGVVGGAAASIANLVFFALSIAKRLGARTR